MIKTPLSTVIGGVGMYTKNSLIIGSGKTEPPFDPKSLFENGEIGTLLDATDLSTIYQDSRGNIAVDSAGQAVGLILDNSKKIALGEELIPKIDFNEWSKTANVDSFTKNTFTTKLGAGGVNIPLFTNELLRTKTFQISISCNLVGGTGVIRNSGVNISPIPLPIGNSNIVSTNASLASGGSSLYLAVNGVGSLELYSLSVKEVLGNHAYQTTSAARPILQNDIKFDGIDDALNIAFPSALTNCTIFTVKHGQQAQILEAQSVAQNHTINQDFKYYGIVNRALTSAERAGLVSYLNKLGAQ